MTRTICVDTGYSETKVYQHVNGQNQTTIFPSTFGKTTFAENFLNTNDDSFIVEVGEEIYNFGETAIEKNAGGTTTLDKDVFVKDYNPLLTIAAVARQISRYQLPLPETLVVSLPIAFFKDQKGAMEERFRGKHNVALYKSDGKKTQSYQLNFRHVHVLPQGYMAFLSKALDVNGNTVPEFMKGMITIIDGGGKTIDITRIQNGQMLPTSTSIPTGLDDIYRKIQDECYAAHDECPERPQIEYQIIRKEPYIMQNGETVDFDALRQKYVQADKHAFLSRLRQAVGQSRIGRLFVCGGSGKIYFPLIQEAYPGAEELTPSVFANAIGGFRYALTKA
ncbi:MAG: ParM/StbA family protein [Acidobacteria bacterium]|nr:ParM/StbA family protein [Acidobacteriota bacterium]